MRKMSYLLLIIILIKSKEIEDTCSFYNINNSITECLDQAGPFPHYFCCGLNISYAETKVSRCFPIQGSKPAVDILRSNTYFRTYSVIRFNYFFECFIP